MNMTTRATMAKGIALAVAAMFLAGTAGATLIQNGGFESGLNAWAHSCNVDVRGSWWGVSAYEGDAMAVMSPLGLLDSDLSQTFDPAEYSELNISFMYNLVAFDMTDCGDFGNDSFTVSLGSYSWNFELDDIFDDQSRSTSTGWTLFDETVSLQAGAPGSLTIGFNVENAPPGGGDWGQLMAAFIDAVSVSGVGTGEDPRPEYPEPVPDAGATVMALAIGLLGLEFVRRRIG